MAPEASAHEAPVAAVVPPTPRTHGWRVTGTGRSGPTIATRLSRGGVISGWLLFFGYAGAIFLPIVGLIIGIALLVKKATGHGVAVLAISIAMFALGFAITTGEDGDAGRSGGRSMESACNETPLVLSVTPCPVHQCLRLPIAWRRKFGLPIR